MNVVQHMRIDNKGNGAKGVAFSGLELYIAIIVSRRGVFGIKI